MRITRDALHPCRIDAHVDPHTHSRLPSANVPCPTRQLIGCNRKTGRRTEISKSVARIKLACLLESEGTLSNDEAARPGTFEEAAVRIVGGQHAEGLPTWTDRLQRLRQFVLLEFGRPPVSDVRLAHVREGCCS